MWELNIGVIGYGLRVGNIFAGLYKNDLGIKVNLTAVCDPKGKEGLLQKLTEMEIDFFNTHFYEDAEEMMNIEKLDGIMIGTRCNLYGFGYQGAGKKDSAVFGKTCVHQ